MGKKRKAISFKNRSHISSILIKTFFNCVFKKQGRKKKAKRKQKENRRRKDKVHVLTLYRVALTFLYLKTLKITRLKLPRPILALHKTAQHGKFILQKKVLMRNTQILSTPFCSLFFPYFLTLTWGESGRGEASYFTHHVVLSCNPSILQHLVTFH